VDLAGARVLVTGASRGIGAAIALEMAAAGADVVITARTTESGGRLPGSLAETADAIASAGGRATVITAALGNAESRAMLADEAGAVDVLVNNAAVTWFDPTLAMKESHLDVMLEIQLRAPIDLVRRLAPGMVERGQGAVLNISSRAARHPAGPPYAGPGATIYGTCKAALERFTTGLAADLYGTGVVANALAPYDVVVTPGVQMHGLDRFPTEPVERMARAAVLLCTGDPTTETGRIVTTRDLLPEG
jgi:NAD(P)-dependent dehydrogenase (short-subunit alcohol dehydrogenase family)